MKLRLSRYFYILPVIFIVLYVTYHFYILWTSGPDNPHEFLNSSYSPQILSKEGKLLWVGLNESDKWCLPVNIDKVSPNLIHATIALEDQHFWDHHGVDLFAVCRAIVQNLFSSKIVSGASTITMQVVKQYYRNHECTIPDTVYRKYYFKLFQAVQSLRLEKYATKKEILQAYLNNVSYGANLVGVESASYRYFGRSAEMLSINESALLAGIPKAPEKYRPDKNLSQSLQRMRFVLKRMNEEGYIDKKRFAEVVKSRVDVNYYPFPAYCKHWAEETAQVMDEKKNVRTFLDYDIQVQIEDILKEKILQWSPEITIASAMVVDVPSGEVLARVGGISKRPRIPVSYLDFCCIPRSPGSALKPFLYCMAMEKGLLFPEEILYDSDFDAGNYSPKNFDEIFHGFIDATTALRYSLNIPAVILMQRTGTLSFIDKLEKSGLNLLKDNPNILNSGLGIVLGNCEVNMENMMQAYFCLANEGLFKRIKYSDDGQEDVSLQVFDRGTISILYKMMENHLVGEVSKDMVRLSREPIRICWKTGTSSGRRDAWAFIFNKHYLVGVWMGNPQSTGSAKLVGALTAYPTACDIFRILPEKKGYEFPDFPNEDVRPVEVCSLSGLPANPYCKSKKTVYVSKNMPLSRICDVHYYDMYTAQVKERFPSQSKGWDLAKVGIISNEGGVQDTKVHLKIISPADGSKFIYSSNSNQNSVRLRTSRDDTYKIYWYIDDRFIGESSSEQPLWWDLTAGKHKIFCLDSTGESDTVYVDVKTPDETLQIANANK
ncbi:MAG: penicillin-binding protein 1C [Candidatus Hydrogenedens sp.]